MPYSVGGSFDIYSRTTPPFVAKRLGATIAVDRVEGAGGLLGALEIARSCPGSRDAQHRHDLDLRAGLVAVPLQWADVTAGSRARESIIPAHDPARAPPDPRYSRGGRSRAFIHKGQITDLGIAYGFVLGTLFESNLQLTRRLQEIDRINIWTRPIALTLMGLAVLSMLMPHLAHRRATRRASSPLPGGPTPDLCARGPRCSGHVRGLDDASSARLVPTFVLVPTAALFL
jgi:hypothetical protein